MLARHLIHGAQDRLVADPAPAEIQQEFHAADAVLILRFDHARAPSLTRLPDVFKLVWAFAPSALAFPERAGAR
jgi:hypothetical protein